MRTNRVEIVAIDSLPLKTKIHRIASDATFAPDEIIQRAVSRLGENEYCVVTNNCEHFVNWCRSDRAASRQVERVFERAAAAAAKLKTRQRFNAAAKLGSRILSGRLAKSATPWLIVADVAQLGTEVTASSRGVEPTQALRAGQVVGLSASIGIGAIAAGPLGAIAGAGFWAVGEVAGKMSSNR